MLKRVMDVGGSLLLLLVLSPLVAATALLVRLFLGSPVLFRQERSGLQGRTFTVLKFRTMTGERDASGRLLSDELRLKKLGRLMRKASLDELPQLINVLRGEMSLVGPRPLLAAYLSRYTPEQARRLLAKPGVTGLVQVSGRNQMEWEEKFALDVWYVDHWSLWLDVKILLRTLLVVLGARGVSQQGHATMPEFKAPGRIS